MSVSDGFDLKLYKEIVENSSDGVIILVDNKIIYSNQTASKIYGTETRDELIEKDILDSDLFPEDQKDRIRRIIQAAITGGLEESVYEFKPVLKDGTSAVFDVSLSSITVNDKTGIVCVICDVSKRREIEKRLKSLHRNMAKLGQASTREEAVEIVIESIRDIFEKQYTTIGFVEGNNLIFPFNQRENLIEELPLDGPGLTVKAIRTRETQLVSDVTSDPDYIDGRLEGKITRSELDVPVFVDGDPIALVTIEEEEPEAFTEEDVQLVEILANHFASALARIKHHNELIELREEHVKELLGGMDKICMPRQNLRGVLRIFSVY